MLNGRRRGTGRDFWRMAVLGVGEGGEEGGGGIMGVGLEDGGGVSRGGRGDGVIIDLCFTLTYSINRNETMRGNKTHNVK